MNCQKDRGEKFIDVGEKRFGETCDKGQAASQFQILVRKKKYISVSKGGESQLHFKCLLTHARVHTHIPLIVGRNGWLKPAFSFKLA